MKKEQWEETIKKEAENNAERRKKQIDELNRAEDDDKRAKALREKELPDAKKVHQDACERLRNSELDVTDAETDLNNMRREEKTAAEGLMPEGWTESPKYRSKPMCSWSILTALSAMPICGCSICPADSMN